MFVHALPRAYGRYIAVVVLLAALVAAEPASPSANVRLEMDALAEKIADFVKEEGGDAVALGSFANRSKVPSNAGPGLAQQLSAALQKQGIQIKDRAARQVGGEYFTDVDPKENRQAVFVSAIIRDDQKNEVQRFGRKIFGARAVVSLMALTVDDLPPDEKEQDAKVRLAVRRPRDYSQGARLWASKDSPYAIEVLVQKGDDYVPRALEDRDGRAFVPLQKGERYAIRLHNQSEHDTAVTLSIDGLSLFAFKDEEATYSHVLVPAGKSGVIKGWYRTRDRADAFTITDYAQSAAARSLKDESAVGAITATFAVAWKESQPAPDGENSRAADIGTGRGPNVEANYQPQQRHFGRTRTSISVRVCALSDIPLDRGRVSRYAEGVSSRPDR